MAKSHNRSPTSPRSTLPLPAARHINRGENNDSLSATKMKVSAEIAGDENVRPAGLWSTVRLARQIERESRVWFMEFVEKVLESGMRKQSLGQGLMIRQRQFYSFF